MKSFLLSLSVLFASLFSYAQSKIVTTGNNVINTSDPYGADVVVGSDQGTRHDGSIMWWSNASASRISNSNDVFYLSVWNTTNANVSLSASFGGSSYMMGNLGLGTNNPLGALHVASAGSQWSGYNWGTNVLVQGSRNNAIGIFDSNTTNPWAIANSGGSFMVAKMPALGDVGTNPDIKFTLTPSGFLGLGTTTPNAPLSIVNSSPVLQLFDSRGNPGDGSGIGRVAFGSILGEHASIEGVRTNGATDDIVSIRFKTSFATGGGGDGDNIERMRIAYNGNVGIGTTSPDQKLTVNGTIHSSEVKVDTQIPVPDYVFKPSYKLTDLTSLEEYLHKYHHLPEIPSANQIEKDGLKLGEMNTLLLKKVEELTLYLIEKDKQLKDQQIKANQQEQRINQLEEKLNELIKDTKQNKQ